ncbi:cell division protein ZapA [Parahaliea sp. F7430]|uniref:Cell division protein ZapA n=1 Tax=Sediminihaliea albiluteola TaxID=2758564 RepID=A0A7W2TX17_9GAMM|nr:cell division protein ZapA [Sediminihaliea albiluteola]MBA6413532.1 cell division protein ZapA [Sediminihaliea albiluteola]
MSKPHTVSVRILDKDYQVASPEDQQAELILSARYLDQKMRAIRDSGKVIGIERIAVMAALNISYELLRATEQLKAGELGGSAADNVEHLSQKIEDALQHLRQLEIG